MKSEFCKLGVIGLAGLLVPSFINAVGTSKANGAADSLTMHSPASRIRRASIVPAEAFQGRLQRIGLEVILARHGGDVVEVNGESVSLGSAGIDLSPDDNLITSAGADDGNAMVSNTTYFVYVSNSSASTFPSDLRGSTAAPTLSNGIKYLGTSGNAANWRFVGWVRTNNAVLFVDGERERYVINYYNRKPLPLRAFSTTDNWTYNTQTWRPWSNSTVNRVSFIANGEDRISLNFTCVAANSGDSACFVAAGLGLDSTTAPASISNIRAGTATWNWVHVTLTADYTGVPSEGFHFLQLLEISENVGTTYWRGDEGNSFMLPGATGYVMG